MIPVAHSSVDIEHLHPTLAARVDASLNDPRVVGRCRLSSGARTYEQQVFLYRKYLAGTGNLAANPDRTRADGFRGSRHMVQPATYVYAPGVPPGRFAYAVDIGWWDPSRAEWKLLRTVCGDHGLKLTVFSPQFEPWHFEIDETRAPEPLIAAAPTPPRITMDSFGIASDVTAYVDAEVVVVYRELADDTGDNFHVKNRMTGATATHRHGDLGDRLDMVTRSDTTLDLTVRRGGNQRITMRVPIP